MFSIYIINLRTRCGLKLILRNERIGDALHTVLWADQDDASASAHHQTETSRILRELVGLILKVKTIKIAASSVAHLAYRYHVSILWYCPARDSAEDRSLLIHLKRQKH